VRCLFVLLLLAPPSMFAQSRFDGTWQMKMDSLRFSGAPEEYLLENGMYHCATCAPRVDVKADGTDQIVTGHYFDTIAVRVVDARSVEFIQKRSRKITFRAVETVSPDSQTMTELFTNTVGAETVTGKAVFVRVKDAQLGSHALSGSWQMQTVKNGTPAGTLTTYRSTMGGLKISDGGSAYEVKFDGKDYPTSGDPLHFTTALKLIDDSTIEETDKQDGTIIVVSLMKVSKDGKWMAVKSADKLRGSTMTYTAVKQP